MFTKAFWIASCERALKTAGQMGVVAIGTVAWTDFDQIVPAGKIVVYAMLFGITLSFLTSMGSAPFGNEGPSLANEAALKEWE